MPMQLCHCGRPVYQEPKIKTPAECRQCRDERENESRKQMRLQQDVKEQSQKSKYARQF